MNIIDIGLVFLEGLALIASPCILPVLPLVLSTSIEGESLRPYGIIMGFILSFSVFALGSASLVKLLGINLDLLKQVSLILLALFGIILLSSRLSEQFNRRLQGLASISHKIAAKSKAGFFSGIFIGCLIGLVWTPCAGPIFAAVLVQIIRQQNTINSAAMVAAFSLGAGIPMLLIALIGRKVMGKLGFFLKHAAGIRKILGVLILLSVAYIAFGMDAQSGSSLKTTPSPETGGLRDALTIPYAAPEFAGIEGWINSLPFKMEDLKGKVVLIDFWTYSCINCIRTLPYLVSWDKKYRALGLVIVGVHSPEFEFEKKRSNVEDAVKKFGILYPVLLDNKLDTWENFHNRYWPAHYLIDKEGRVVYSHFGEGDYDVTEQNIQTLLHAGSKVSLTPETSIPFMFTQTPETYLGYARNQYFSNIAELVQNQVHNYVFPQALGKNFWALQGAWNIQSEKIVSQGRKSSLRLNFNAKKVFLVMGSASNKPIRVTLLLDGKPIGDNKGEDAPTGVFMVQEHRLYELVNLQQAASGILDIQVSEPGLEAFAFTFGA